MLADDAAIGAASSVPGLTADALFEQAPCGYVVTDRNGLLLAANAEFHRMVGAAGGELVRRRRLASMLSVAGGIFLETHLWPMLEHDGYVREVALDLLGPGGARIPVMLNATLAPGPRGEPLVRAVLIETRDRHRYERDLLAAKTAAEQARADAIELAQALQRSFIPPTPPDIPGLSIAAAYRPAGDGSVVGGDFYDFLQVGKDAWVIVLGDVSGKGVEAAAVTAFVRHTVRALAVEHPDPADLLTRLNTALVKHETERYCTLVLATLHRRADGWDLRVCLAGHPPALVRHPDGRVTELGRLGTAVGLPVDPRFTTVDVSLGEEAVTFFTDGVTDARRDGAFFGEERLHTLLGSLPHDPAGITDGITAAVLEHQHGDTVDDVAVVTIQCSPPART